MASSKVLHEDMEGENSQEHSGEHSEERQDSFYQEES